MNLQGDENGVRPRRKEGARSSYSLQLTYSRSTYLAFGGPDSVSQLDHCLDEVPKKEVHAVVWTRVEANTDASGAAHQLWAGELRLRSEAETSGPTNAGGS